MGLLVSFMKPKLIYWNVRGLNDGDKCLRVRNLLREWKVGIVNSCLVLLCAICGVAILWICVVWILVGLQVVF
jgi:Mg/Co/Ni transporter MgtE